MSARHVRRHFVGTETEAELLVELLTSWTVKMTGSLDSFDDVRGCCHRIGGLPEKAALYFCYEGCNMLFCTERAVHVSIDCYDPARSWHLELEVCIVRYHIEMSERSSSK